MLLDPQYMANYVIVVNSSSGEIEERKHQHGCQRSSNNYVSCAFFGNCAPRGRGRAKAHAREEQQPEQDAGKVDNDEKAHDYQMGGNDYNEQSAWRVEKRS